MASSPPLSVKSEPADILINVNEPNSSYTSAYDTSLDNSLIDQIEPTSPSIGIDAPIISSNETSFDLLQGYSAPTLPVYINMGLNEHPDDVNFVGPITTLDQPLSRSLAAIDVDQQIPQTTIQRHSHHHHHHFPHHQQNRNRYPYLQRPIMPRGSNRTQIPAHSFDNLYLYEQRPAFRRSYFALRRQRIPKAPPMPKHLFPGYKQSRTERSTMEGTGSENENVDEDEEGKFSFFFFF
ncbi:unnamed protein product [Rotaria sp. Silwood1]|nr:unnamed protein product [Rotaria sp. Silwood1]CAF3562925.1 unnamed protein product [Rotaria sp. Silwood1]CAF4510354.1 unnamed protein product [Rotaria sp. Silwood1]CAF4540015.1 unnamed protein product [Rotaria sp. Silwood1]CAF4621338.1 unnamed protein product [Rotaria sp. Silwood1]